MRRITRLLNWLRTTKKIPIEYIVDNREYFKKKTVLVLGGTGGIGFEIASAFADAGANVIISGSNNKTVEDKVLLLKKKFADSIKGCVIDLNEPETFSEKILFCSELFGTIDIFINSAGVHTENVDFWKISEAEFERVININLKSSFFIVREIGKYMISNKIKGDIIMVSSSRGYEPAWSPYGISKWGLEGFVKGAAKIFLPYGIAVNCIAPGTTATKLIGFEEGSSIESEENTLGRIILPGEVAQLVKCIVGRGGVISGETIRVSAGRGVFDIR